jgi:hypothetical protein
VSDKLTIEQVDALIATVEARGMLQLSILDRVRFKTKLIEHGLMTDEQGQVFPLTQAQQGVLDDMMHHADLPIFYKSKRAVVVRRTP